MRKEDFFEVLGELDDDIVKGARTMMKKKLGWKVWVAIAACLCLIVGTTVFLQQNTTPGGVSIPGTGSGGIDGGHEGMMYSVAVYPAAESEENVDSAGIISLTESEALSHELAEHLPSQLPGNFHYGRGSIYNTIMKDGTQYNMLRVEYISGTIPGQQFTEDGGAVAPNPETIGSLFTVCVLNYKPKTDISIYSSAEEITVSILEENGAAYIHSGDCYIGVFTETAEPESVLDALRNIN
ncbi:hypothetical protein D1159_12160 [Pseudoflavonifractor sp. 524-17]|uniref:hypothetical protein n=1 Tax=Pseudoflavonifractor sp. 524-17 TaxID=2304577 RepID=UPI00137B828C|nr:hypothetical protein [Pseudoflavonifractor sp. 524-17]NCE65312.1 hypothetical protein [Pseudoflavonifractor sp. 524-17]